jgi:hypothetical protein
VPAQTIVGLKGDAFGGADPPNIGLRRHVRSAPTPCTLPATRLLRSTRARCLASTFVSREQRCVPAHRSHRVTGPKDSDRLFFPFRSIEVSPINPRGFLTDGAPVLASEFIWVWIPILILVASVWVWRRRQTVDSVDPGFGAAGCPCSCSCRCSLSPIQPLIADAERRKGEPTMMKPP